jgi:hypothetical protein
LSNLPLRAVYGRLLRSELADESVELLDLRGEEIR